MKITAEMAYRAWCVACFEEAKDWSQLYKAQQSRFVVMADSLNKQLKEEQEEESRLLLYNPTTQKSYRISPKEEDA